MARTGFHPMNNSDYFTMLLQGMVMALIVYNLARIYMLMEDKDK